MKSSTLRHRFLAPHMLAALLSASALGWLGVGCGGEAEGPEPLAAEEIPQVVEEAFQDNGEAAKRQKVQEVLAALQTKDNARAYLLLQELIARRDLTDDERDAASRSLVSVGAWLNAAAAAGDSAAKGVVNTHQVHK